MCLAKVVDAFSRKVVGWAMVDHRRTDLVVEAVGITVTTRKPAAGTVHRADRETQYISYEFAGPLLASCLLASMGGVASMGRAASIGCVASAFNNAMAESVFRHPGTRVELPPLLACPP